jgi:L-galactose dehydrogenase
VLALIEVDAILSYFHHCLADSTLVDELPWLSQRGIGVINGSPLSMGLLISGVPPAWHSAPSTLRVDCAVAAELCRQVGVERGELALPYELTAPVDPTATTVASTLVGIRSTEEVERNVAALRKLLDHGLLARGQEVLAPYHNQPWESGLPENNHEQP